MQNSSRSSQAILLHDLPSFYYDSHNEDWKWYDNAATIKYHGLDTSILVFQNLTLH